MTSPSADLSFFWIDSVSVQTYEGQDAAGPVLAAAVNVPCFVDETSKLVRNKGGDQLVSASTVYADASQFPVFAEQSRVTYDGQTSTVISCERLSSDGLNFGIDHIAAHLL